MTERAPTDVIRTLYALFGEGRIDETFDLMHDDVRIVEPGDPEVLPWAGTLVGHDGLRTFYAGLSEGLEEIAIDPDSLRLLEVEGGRVLALGRERGVSAATGRAYHTHSAWLWEVRDGKVAGMEAFHDTWAMMEAMAG